MDSTKAKSVSHDSEVTRRQALALLGAAGAAALAGCQTNLGDDTGDGGTGGDSGLPSCVVTPEATEGPYFVDELLNRSDIRSDPSGGSVQDGLPLRLRIKVSQVSGSLCTALAGAAVDIWHCNAEGLYSDVAANDTVGQEFLRGYQVADENGEVEFTTIYPGWYRGRTVHIHFKVRTDALEFTSQWYFDEAVTDAVYAQDPYRQRGSPDTTNARDNIFNEDTLLTLSPESEGYLGTFDIGLRMS